MTIERVASEAELDSVEKPVREAFTAFLADVGLLDTDTTVLGLTFRTGGLHFAAKALEFVPQEQQVLVVGTNLSGAEIDFLARTGRPVFNHEQRFDNELVYEMLMDGTSGAFGWVDADCFVLKTAVWDELLAPHAADVGSHTAFTYDPGGFAMSPLVVWNKDVREVLRAENTTLNSYALEPTNVGRAAPYSISRIFKDNHHRHLQQVLGVDGDRELNPHDGLLDVFDNGRTVNTRRRHLVGNWFGPEVRRTGWLVDTPMMAEVVLRANGFTTKRVIPDNVQINDDIVHVGASSYRDRMRTEGANATYLARFRLTDLFEVLLADELVAQGVTGQYQELSAAQKERLRTEAGIDKSEIKPMARSILAEEGLDVDALRQDRRLAFLF
ncbi:hypothetical protein [Actinokineospora inagensis]|uniref:hypothetical protein n=1 Tax=Actinokineospora inagensis TaxID=103730 RepID=UPI0004288DF0|nr:hypothetical protein [Actinokineospora inagensis]